jgi:hypothetical protein
MFSLIAVAALTFTSLVSGRYLRGPGMPQNMSSALIVAPSHALILYKKPEDYFYVSRDYTNSSIKTEL